MLSSRTRHVVAPTPRFCGNQKNVAPPFPALAPQGVKKCPTERDQVPGTPYPGSEQNSAGVTGYAPGCASPGYRERMQVRATVSARRLSG